MARCPNCGESNSVKRTVCFHCGRPLSAERGAQQAPRRAAAMTAEGAHLLYGSLPRVRAAALFFRKLYTLSEAGFSPVEALSQLSRQGPGAFRAVAAQMAEHATAGGLLSDVMEGFPGLFLTWQTGLVRAAETGGFLPAAFGSIASALEDECNLRLAILSRTWYLYFVVLVMLLLLPLAVAFAGRQHPEGWTLQALLDSWVSGFRRASLPAALGIVAASFLWQFGARLPSFRAAQQRVALHLPLFGHVSRTAAMTRFTETLASLWQAGIAPNTAVEVAAAACGNYALAPRLARIAPALQQGQPAASLLGSTGLLPAEMVQLLHAGEVSGSLAESIARVAGYYRSELQIILRRLPWMVFWLAWAMLVPFVIWMWYVFLRTYVYYRFDRPLEEIWKGVR